MAPFLDPASLVLGPGGHRAVHDFRLAARIAGLERSTGHLDFKREDGHPIAGLSWMVRETWAVFVPEGASEELMPPPHPANAIARREISPSHEMAFRMDTPPPKDTPEFGKRAVAGQDLMVLILVQALTVSKKRMNTCTLDQEFVRADLLPSPEEATLMVPMWKYALAALAGALLGALVTFAAISRHTPPSSAQVQDANDQLKNVDQASYDKQLLAQFGEENWKLRRMLTVPQLGGSPECVAWQQAMQSQPYMPRPELYKSCLATVR